MTNKTLRRSIAAFLAGLTVFLVLSAGFGLAAAGDESQDFTLAQRRVGDQGSWVRTSYMGDEAPEYLSSTTTATAGGGSGGMGATASISVSAAAYSNTTFEWLPAELFHHPDGTWRVVHPYLEVTPDAGLTTTVNGRSLFFPAWSKTFVDAATDEVVAVTRMGGGGASGYSGLQSSEEITTMFLTTSLTEDSGCTLAAKLRSGVTLDKPIAASRCLEGDAVFHYDGAEDVRGLDAARFVATNGNVTVTHWYNPGVPVALRIEEVRVLEAGKWTTRTELAQFSRGTEAWESDLQAPPPTEAIRATPAPSHPWGPEDAGVDHPYSLSMAWTQARDDPTYSDFREFLAANPDAFALHANYDEDVEDDTVTRAWGIFVYASDGTFFLRATQRDMPADAVVAEILGIPAVGPRVQVYTHTTGTSSFGTGGPPPTMPEQLPSVASMLGAWEAFTGRNDGNTWSFDACCGDGLTIAFGVERVQRDQPGLLGPGSDAQVDGHTLRFDLDGTVVGWDETVVTSHVRDEEVVVGAIGGAQDFSARSKGGIPIAGATIWSPPNTPAAAGISLLAILAGVVTWLWPTVKAGGVAALFSRVHGSALLQHPERADLMARIEAQPGVHYQALARATGLGNGALEHHLRKLVTGGLATSVRQGGYTCYFAKGHVEHGLMAAAPALKSDGARKVLEAVRARPGSTGLQVAEATGLDRATVHHHLGRLKAGGLVDVRRAGRSLAIHPSATADAALAMAS